MNYEVIRSKRKTIGLQVRRDGSVVVRAPLKTTDRQIAEVVAKHADWIETHRKKQLDRGAARPEPTPAECEALRRRAHEIIPPLVARWSAVMGIKPIRITVTGAKTRFGSCSGKNAVSFSYRLMRYPPEAIEYVVVHELAHIRHHDHSPAFWAEVETYLPDYRERRALLR